MKEVVIYLALIICILGWLIWMACIRMTTPPKGIAETGEYMFWVGLLAFLLGK